ncbi:hypothetical protein RND81_13G081500 [Saponaria officinalis]|uniref:Avr9/Cf-9 rapidly elicited protein 137 n=1 Tax=Saponaria officinalis TaxID=3572 RepID=A0AAW1GXC3_SAPOF
MVVFISWLTEHRRFKTDHNHNNNNNRWMFKNEKLDILGILAFDTAKSVSRLVSLYKALSQNEVQRLRNEVIKSRGISFLVSQDDGFLMKLACAERLEDLDRAANAVARLGLKCSDYGLVRFGQVYKDLKAGFVDMEKLNNYGSKEMEKSVNKMEKFTSLTGELYAELEVLAELEASERRLIEWKKKNNNTPDTNYDLFDQKVYNQRKLVRHLKDVSLWNQCYDKIVGRMAKMVCLLYARICTLFGPHVSTKYGHKNHSSGPTPQTSMSGPIHCTARKAPLVRFLSRDSNVFITEPVGLRHKTVSLTHEMKIFQAAPPSTVGGSGLANRYANVILLAAKYLNSETLISDQAREKMYNMLPNSLIKYVRSKLRVAWRETEEEVYGCDALAEGWRQALNEMLEWLVPMAQDTLTWQAERNLEKQRFDAKPIVLLMQTLHYADLEKTEAVIAEILVGLSCVYWYENRRISCVDMDVY